MNHETPQTRPGVILTPDQRIRVFISSTLEELAAERVAARRAIQRLHLVSRAKLNVTGETVFTLAGLETTWDSPAEVSHVSGVQLFIDAARRVRPRFVLEPSDLDPLAKILGLIGGLPLGILLAAAWVDMLPLSEIATEIAKNADFLETDISDVPNRHRSLRAAFDYSWALLSPEERKVFLALSIFRGGFSREAAQAVAGGSLRGLSILVDKSLVTASPKTRRYALHELLRQYAKADLRQDLELNTQVSEAHAAFYASLTEESFTLFTQADQPGCCGSSSRTCPIGLAPLSRYWQCGRGSPIR